MIEFIAQFRIRRTGNELSPTTLKSNIAGIQRGFLSEWAYKLDLFNGHIFADKKAGVGSVLDKKIRQRQAAGAVRKSHNNLSTDDIVKLYMSEMLSKETPREFITRTILNLVFMTSFRKSELWALRMSDVTLDSANEENFWRVVGRIGN